MKRKFLCAALLSFSLNNLVYASNVDSFEQLNEAIQKNTESQINITSDIQFNSDLIEQAIEDLTIDAGHNSLLGNEHRGFIVDKDYNLTVLNIGSGTNDTSKSASGFKANGTYDGGVITFKSDGKLTVKNSTFYNNKNIYTSGGSGAINITKRRTTEADIEKKAQVFIDNSYFFNNEGNGAGAINADVKRLDVSNSQFSYNNAVYRETVVGNGGAINIKGDEEYTDSVLNITNSLFSYNNADAEGGAIASSDIAKINIVSSQFLNNKSGDNGGALYIQGTPNINITDSEFSNNVSPTAGAIYIGNSFTHAEINTVIKSSTFTNNRTESRSGGAISTVNNLDIIDSVFTGNSVTGGSAEGGAIYLGSGKTMNISGSTFTNNSANSYYGGAVSVFSSKKISIIDSEFNNNTARNGGAIYLASDYAVIADTNFTGNTATSSGGAIDNDAEVLNIFADTKNVIFNQNSCNSNGADIWMDSSSGELNLTAATDKNIQFNGGLYGVRKFSDLNINKENSYDLIDGSTRSVDGNGEIQFNNDVQNFNVNLFSGMLSIGQNSELNKESSNPDGFMNNTNFTIKGDSTLNTVNGIIGSFQPQTFNIDSGVTWEYHFDIDLENETADKLFVTDNKGTLKLGRLNIITDTDKEEVKIKYSDTNLEGQLKDGYKITTSTQTYKVSAENDNDEGSSLLIQQDFSSYGLAGAVKEGSDQYSNTSGSDEIVDKWLGKDNHDNQLKNDLAIFANDKGIIAGQENIDGLIVGADYSLSVDDAKDFSGFNIAIDNEGQTDINNSNFTNNKGEAALKNTNGKINIHASNDNITFNNPDCDNEILSDGGSINIDGGNSVTFEGSLSGSNNAELNLNASNVTFKDEISGFNVTQEAGNVDVEKLSDADYYLKGGTLNVADESSFDVNDFTFGNGNLNLSNGKTGDLKADNFNLNGKTNVSVDVDLANEQMDRLTSDNSSYLDGGEINVNKFNVFSQGTKSNLRVNFTDNDILKEHVSTDVKNVRGPIFNYKVSYDPENGDFLFTGGGNNASGYNPAVLASPIAAQLGGYLTQLNSYDEAFRNMDMYMLMTKEQRNALKFKNKYAQADSNLIYDPIISKNERSTGWIRPYTTFENVPLKSGKRVSNTAYGSFIGLESPMYDLGYGWDGMYSVYAGYNGSHQAYDGVSIYQNGGTLGVVGMAYKDNFFTGLTANVGSNIGEASTMYGDEDFNMLMAGIASKSGYNFEFKDGKYIIQPNLIMSYSMVNTFDYTNAAGIRINADPLHAIQVEPGVKFITNLNNGWQPYLGVNFIYNILDKTNFTANDVSLPELSVKPFVKYGAGVRKSYGERVVGYLQTYITNGGRNGIGIQSGFRISIGK